MSDGVSLRELARRLGVSEGAVRKARDSGRIKAAILPDGKIDPEMAVALWQRNTDPSLQREAPARPQPPATGDAPQPSSEPRSKGPDITVARTKLVFENALMAEVKRKSETSS